MNRSMVVAASLSCFLVACGGEYSESEDHDDVVELVPQALRKGEVVTFKNLKSGRCIGVDGASTANGALLKQFTCVDGAPNQQWRIGLVSSVVAFTFTNIKSGKCMGVDGASTSPGANLGQYNCLAGAPNQQWLPNSVPTGRNIENIKSEFCIGVDGGSTANGAQLKQFICNLGAPNQKWDLLFQ